MAALSTSKQSRRKSTKKPSNEPSLATISNSRKIKLVEQRVDSSPLSAAFNSIVSRINTAFGENKEKILNSVYGMLTNKNLQFSANELFTNLGMLINRSQSRKVEDLIISIFERAIEFHTEQAYDAFSDFSIVLKCTIESPDISANECSLIIMQLFYKKIPEKIEKTIHLRILEAILNFLEVNKEYHSGKLFEIMTKTFDSNKKCTSSEWSQENFIPILKVMQTIIMSIDTKSKDGSFIWKDSIKDLQIDWNDKNGYTEIIQNDFYNLLLKAFDLFIFYCKALIPKEIKKIDSHNQKAGTNVSSEVITVLLELIKAANTITKCNQDFTDYTLTKVTSMLREWFPFYNSNSTQQKLELSQAQNQCIEMNILLIDLYISIFLNSKSLLCMPMVYSYITKLLKIKRIDSELLEIILKILKNEFLRKTHIKELVGLVDSYLDLNANQNIKLGTLIEIYSYSQDPQIYYKLLNTSPNLVNRNDFDELLRKIVSYNKQNIDYVNIILKSYSNGFCQNLINIISLTPPKTTDDWLILSNKLKQTSFDLQVECVLDFLQSLWVHTLDIENFCLFLYDLIFDMPNGQKNNTENVKLIIFSSLLYLEMTCKAQSFIPEIISYLPVNGDSQTFEKYLAFYLTNSILYNDRISSKLENFNENNYREDLDSFKTKFSKYLPLIGF